MFTLLYFSHQWFIPSFVEIGPPVLETIFERFLPYMGMAASLVIDLDYYIHIGSTFGRLSGKSCSLGLRYVL